MSAPRLLIIQHEDDCPPAWFGQWFRAAGVEYDVVLAHRGEPVPDDLGAYDGLVVLGGEMGAYDEAAHPWLAPTKALIATVVGAGRCFLGICLGHQLAAVALGGEVIANPLGQATGLTQVILTEAGAADEVMRAIPDGAMSIQWNGDVVSRLPESAVELATAPDGTVQAARFAPYAWGVQFHPEASPAIFESWIEHSAITDSALRERVDAAMRDITAYAGLKRDWEPLARRFADVVVSQLVVS